MEVDAAYRETVDVFEKAKQTTSPEDVQTSPPADTAPAATPDGT